MNKFNQKMQDLESKSTSESTWNLKVQMNLITKQK